MTPSYWLFLATFALLGVVFSILAYAALALIQWRQNRRIAREGDWLKEGRA